MMDLLAKYSQRFDGLDDEPSLLVDIKSLQQETNRAVQATAKRMTEREKEEAAAQQKRAQEVGSLAAELALSDDLDLEDPSMKEEHIKENAAKVKEKLQEDADAVGPEPPTYLAVIQPLQALPALQVKHLAVIQQLLSMQDQVDDDSSSSEECALATFAGLLREKDQLLACPNAEFAQAVFSAVYYGSSELAQAAYNKFLSWCGVVECLAASDELPGSSDQSWNTLSSTSSAALAGCICQADQQPHVTCQWLPSAQDFVEALTGMGCSGTTAHSTNSSGTPAAGKKGRGGAAAASPSDQQQQQQQLVYGDANMRLVLQLLGQLCRLGLDGGPLAGHLQLVEAHSAHGRQLLVLLMRLMLDDRAACACKAQLPAALHGVMGVVGASEWGRLEKQLLEALAPGLGPSNRSTILVLSQLPPTDRGRALQQQGALQLLAKMVGKKHQARTSSQASTGRQLHQALVALLAPTNQRGPDKALLARFTRTGRDGKPQLDTWALLDMLNAADLVMWGSRPGGAGMSGELRSWFMGWLERLERALGQNLNSLRVRSRLAELSNAYEFSTQLGVPSGAAAGGDDGSGEGDGF